MTLSQAINRAVAGDSGVGHLDRRMRGGGGAAPVLSSAKLLQIGDSIAAGSLTSGYCAINNLGYGAGVVIDNTQSVSGQTIFQFPDLAQPNGQPNGLQSYYDAVKPSIAIIQRATNDFGNWGRDSTQTIERLARVALYAKLQGYYLVGMTVLPRSDAGWNGTKEGYRTAYNTAVRAKNLSSGGINFALDAVIDVASIPLLANPADTTYYVDLLHPTNAGQDQEVPSYKSALNLFAGFSPAAKTATSITGATLSSASFTTGPFAGKQAMSGGTGTTPIVPTTTTLPLTVEFWFQFSGTPSLAVIVGAPGPGGAGFRWYVGVDSTGIRASTHNGSVSTDIVAPGPFNDNLWHHYALVMQGTGATVYVDGTAVGSNAIAADLSTTNGAVNLRCLVPGSFALTSGNLAELLITNSAKYTSNFTRPANPFGANGSGGISGGGIAALGSMGLYDLNGDGWGLK